MPEVRALPDTRERIRTVRNRRGLTVRGLARAAGVSASLISQIETGKAQPSVGTLYAVADALRIGVEDLLTVVDGGHPQGGPGPGRVSAGERETIDLESGVRWEMLGQVPDVHTEFLRITYPPGSASSESGRLMRHPGTEYGYLISGELVLSLGFDEQLLRPGDAVSFSSSTPHAYRNDGAEPAVGIWFVRED